MNPDKLDEVGAALEGEMAELRAFGPPLRDKPERVELGWLARRSRRIRLDMEVRRSGPVLVLSIWSESTYGTVYPIRDATMEIAASQLPVLASMVAKGLRATRTLLRERLTFEAEKRSTVGPGTAEIAPKSAQSAEIEPLDGGRSGGDQ